MAKPRGFLISTLIAGIIATGCQQTAAPDMTVCEYKPGQPPTQVNLADAGRFALLRRDKLTSEGLTTEVDQFEIDGGSKLGFELDHQRLVAVAGPTTLPLDPGTYSWEAMTFTPGVKKLIERREQAEAGPVAGFFTIVASPFVAVADWIAGLAKGLFGTS